MRIVITHHNADLDALASVVAACKLHAGALGVRGATVSLAAQRYLALHKDHFPLVAYSAIDPAQVEEVIVVDVRDRTRLAEYAPILARAPRIVVYDHHPASPDDLLASLEIVEPVGACVTILCERIQESEVALDGAEATLMLLGLYADTGQLSFASTTPRDVDAAAFLLRAGANLKVVTRYLEQQYTPEQRLLLLSMIPNTEELRVDGVDMALACATTERFVTGAAEVIDRVMAMGGHETVFGIIEFTRDKRTQVIARSQVGHVDVGSLMQTLGGGGHAGAAAATFKRESLEQVKAKVLALLESTTFRPTRVREIMSSPVQTLAHDTILGRAKELLARWNVRGVPVLRDGQLRGVLSRRDVERAKTADALALPVSAFMAHEVATIGVEATLEDALEAMTSRDVGRLPVLEDGRLVGIVSRTDVIRFLYDKQAHTRADGE
ncbi:MAG: CBS domain-containing protein [Bradymonadaceae bacterium]|nr:CBS domain-containing protein [Lujinxingiaceae bacterium]